MKYITRTIVETEIKYVSLTRDANGNTNTVDGSICVEGTVNLEDAAKAIAKAGIIGVVTSVEPKEYLWGITLDDFKKYGVPVTRPESQMRKGSKDTDTEAVEIEPADATDVPAEG